MKNYSALEKNILNLLPQKKFEDILKILRKPQNKEIVNENIWSIIKSICSTVKENSLLKNDEDIIGCQTILLFLGDKGKPKEVLIAFLEQADTFKDNEFFCMLLEPLKVVLKNTPGKRGKSLQWVLSALHAHIETLKNPSDLDLQGEEKLLLDLDPAVPDAVNVLRSYLKFIQFFVGEVSFENMKKKEIYYIDRLAHQQEIIQRYILKLFHQPLLYHDLTIIQGKPKSSIQVVCESYISCLSKICLNVFNLFDLDCSNRNNSESAKTGKDVDEDDNCVSLLSFANLSYLIFVENMTVYFQPFVYSHIFTLSNNLKYIMPLLKEKENLVLFKGLQLSNVLLSRINDLEIMFDCFELDGFIEFPKLLFNVAIFSPIKSHRHSAYQLFQTFASKCDYKVQFYIIMKVISMVEHSGVQGVLIDLYRKNLHEEITHRKSNIFIGKSLNKFVEKVFVLKEGVQTDIVENADKIVATLNLLKYLLLRDKKSINATGIWNLTNQISKTFLEPLSPALDLSRAHYKEASKTVNDRCKVKHSLNTTVRVNNEVLPNIPPSFQKDVYSAALTTFDFIEYILAHVREMMSD